MSRSRIKNRNRSPWSPSSVNRLRACWVTVPRGPPPAGRAPPLPRSAAVVAAMTQLAEEMDAVRARQRDLRREARGGVEVRALARTSRVFSPTVYGWLKG
jgi:hypothetical protein